MCSQLNRRFITGDVSPVACRVIIDRLKKINCSHKIVNPPLRRQEWMNMDSSKFEEMICMFMGWIWNPSSKPVDGWVDKNKTIPVEIKNHNDNSNIKSEIQKLSGHMTSQGLKEGVFVSWHFTKGCYDLVNALDDNGHSIELYPAHKIIGELVLTKKEMEKHQAFYEETIKESKQKPRILHNPKVKKERVSRSVI